jgi:hypothetical protein
LTPEGAGSRRPEHEGIQAAISPVSQTRLIDGISEGTQFGFIVGQSFVVQALSSAIEGDGMVVTFTDIDANEDIDRAMLLVFFHG